LGSRILHDDIWRAHNPCDLAAWLRGMSLIFGGGDVAPLTREVLRQVEPGNAHRPQVHVG
jgi:hypothetical protein